MIQAVLFDFNGVIIDDEPLHQKAFRDVLAAEGVGLTEEEYMTMLGMDDATFVRTAFERAGAEPTEERMRAVIEREAAAHRAMLEEAELPLFHGVVNFVKALARKYPLGLVSMAERAEIDYGIGRALLAPYFSAIVSAEDVHACKPDPECYLLALERLNRKRGEAAAQVITLRPSECLVVEDSPPGILSARGAGMRTLGVTNTVSDKALREAGAEVVTANLADWTVDTVHHLYDQ